MSLTEQEIIRREKLQKLTDMGINAFPAEEYKVTHTTQSIKENFEEGKKVNLAGRLNDSQKKSLTVEEFRREISSAFHV